MSAGSPNLIFVVGMHRSGTSALTRVMSLCGAALPRGLSTPGEDNPTGHWEPLQAKEINDGFLHARSSSWDDPGLDFRSAPRDHASFARYVGLIDTYLARIRAFLVHEIDRGAGTVVLKEPRITALLPYWLSAADECGFRSAAIHIFRHPADVAASLSARDGIAFDHACMLWRKYNLLGERDARAIPRAFVAYESLMEDWRGVMERCYAKLGIEADLGERARNAVSTFLSPQLHHHRRGAVGAAAAASAEWQRTLRAYATLRRCAAGSPETAELDALLTEYARTSEAGALAVASR